MANSTAQNASSTASTQATGGTSLRGRIEAIGVFDLMRIGVTNESTGRLLVFNDTFDAELYYVEGRLVAIVSGNGIGAKALELVQQMTEGEFEFVSGIEIPVEQHDESLHEAMTSAIKSHYQQRVRARQESSRDLSVTPRTSGVHRAVGQTEVSVSPIVNIEQPSISAIPQVNSADASGQAPQLLEGENGRATTDIAGRTRGKLGVVTPQEAALVALTTNLAKSLTSILGMRDLQRFEIRGADNRGLLCRLTADGIRLSCVTEAADITAIWRQLDL